MKVGIIGCGLIGNKRAKALVGQAEIAICADKDFARAQMLAQQFPDCVAVNDWHQIVSMDSVNIVIIATHHELLPQITLAAIKAGKHVLVEKPAARRADELIPVIAAAQENNVMVHVGFNHRYHRALRKARELIDQDAVGELMFLRARYGHGGRIGYDKEWRAIPQMSGGGELIDQGMHIIDLSRWFLGDFAEVQGFAHTYYWNMPVDDNGFLLLKNNKQQVAFLHASCSEWKNLFSFEIYGRTGKIAIDGLGGSYGVERIAYYKMAPEMGPPATTVWEYPMADDSWQVECAEFLQDIQLQRQPAASLQDAQAALAIVEEVYRQSGMLAEM
jgi:predicted dehydrogenase